MTDYVTVACKLPNGLVMDLQPRNKDGVPSGPKREFTLNGGAGQRTMDGQEFANHPLAGGYGLTQVPQDFWDAWLIENQDYGPVRNGMIFAAGSQDKAADRAAEQAEIKTGLEAIDPEKPGPDIEPAKPSKKA